MFLQAYFILYTQVYCNTEVKVTSFFKKKPSKVNSEGASVKAVSLAEREGKWVKVCSGQVITHMWT